MNYFTSDWHLSHISLLHGIRGNIFKTKEEHDEVILQNTLELLKPGDNLYHLGDVFWKYDSQQKEEFFTLFKKKRINFHWVMGNHDKYFKHSAIKWIGPIKETVIEKQPVTLCHYPMVVYNRSHYNAWGLYGHIHKGDATYKTYEKLPEENILTKGKRLNVNVDFHNYKPWTFEEIKEHMDKCSDNWDLIRKENRYDVEV